MFHACGDWTSCSMEQRQCVCMPPHGSLTDADRIMQGQRDRSFMQTLNLPKGGIHKGGHPLRERTALVDQAAGSGPEIILRENMRCRDIQREESQIQGLAQGVWIRWEVFEARMFSRLRRGRWECRGRLGRGQGEDPRRSDGVGVDVEFCDGRDLGSTSAVPGPKCRLRTRPMYIPLRLDRTSHHHQLLHPQKSLWVLGCCKGNVRHRTDGHYRDRARLILAEEPQDLLMSRDRRRSEQPRLVGLCRRRAEEPPPRLFRSKVGMLVHRQTGGTLTVLPGHLYARVNPSQAIQAIYEGDQRRKP